MVARLNFDLFAMSHFCQDFIRFAIEQEVFYFGEFKTAMLTKIFYSPRERPLF